MVKNQFDALPQDIEQAARLDGLRVWQVLLRITLPRKTDAGGVGAVRLAAGTGRVFYALLFTSNITAQTLPVTIAGFTAGRATDDGLVAAVGILASVPPLFIAIWLQKRWSAVSLTVEVKDNYANAHRACALYRR